MTTRSIRSWAWVLGMSLLLVSCTRAAPERGTSATLIGGTPIVNDVNQPTSVLHIQGAVDCSGVLISNQWVLTARNCISSALAAQPASITVSVGVARSDPSQSSTVAEVILSPAGWGLALLRLATPFIVNGVPYGYQLRTYANYSEYLAAGVAAPQLTCFSWGRTDPSAPPPEVPVSLSLSMVGFPSPLLRLASPTDAGVGGGVIGEGDAGAPCLTFAPTAQRWVLVGVLVGEDGKGNGIAIDMTRPQMNAWVEATITGRDPDVAVNTASIPAAASPDGQEIDLFWVDASGAMNQTRLQPDGPSVSLGLQADDPFAPVRPAAAYVGADLHVFGRTVGGRVLEMVVSAGVPRAWAPITSLPAIDSGIGIASRLTTSQLDLFARAADRTIVHASSDGSTQWSAPDVLGGTTDSDILATWADNPDVDTSLHTFSVMGGDVLHKWMALGPTLIPGWQPAQDGWTREIYGIVNSATSTVSTDTLIFDMFAMGLNGHLLHKPYVGWWMNDFLDLGMAVPGEPVAVLAGARIHVFARNPDGTIWHVHLPR